MHANLDNISQFWEKFYDQQLKLSINMHLKVVYTENNVLSMYLEFIVKSM